MKRVVLLCLLLAGCAQRMEPQNEPIALLYSAEEASKTDALTVDDPVSVYAAVDGAGNYFLENSRWTVGPDGKALVPPQPVLYPDPKQAVGFYAYFGSPSVPTDQSTPAALKQADLCWASASSTPSHAPVPLAFSHVFARLAVTCSQPTAKITAINAFSGGTLDIRSGTFANSTKSDVSTTGNELIVPAQTLNRLVVTSNGVDYVFDGSIALEPGKTTTANLTLNPSTKTATLNGSSVSAWIASTQSGNLSEAVSNVLTLHWPNFIQQGALPDKVLLTINGSDYTVSSGISYANQTFTVPFASSTLRYPYTVTKITFYSGSTQSLPACTQLLGATVYKSAAQTLGIKDPTNAVKIGNLWWAVGNLVADGPNGCKIGAPADCGLYFQYGGLIGWSSGTNGDGSGLPSNSVACRAVVYPKTYTGVLAWTANYWYPTPNQEITRDMIDNPTLALGDACRYYLGGTWRMPTLAEMTALAGVAMSGLSSVWLPWSSGAKGRWVLASQTFDGISGPGSWWGNGLSNGVGTPSKQTNIFLPASGYRYYDGAVLTSIGTYSSIRTTTASPSGADYLSVAFSAESSTFSTRYYWTLQSATCIRCVSDAI